MGLSTHGLTVGHGGQALLGPLDLDLAAGECLGLVGESGSRFLVSLTSVGTRAVTCRAVSWLSSVATARRAASASAVCSFCRCQAVAAAEFCHPAFRLGGRSVIDLHLVATLDLQVTGHGETHDAQTDECDLCHSDCLCPFAEGQGIKQESRQAKVASVPVRPDFASADGAWERLFAIETL